MDHFLKNESWKENQPLELMKWRGLSMWDFIWMVFINYFRPVFTESLDLKGSLLCHVLLWKGLEFICKKCYMSTAIIKNIQVKGIIPSLLLHSPPNMVLHGESRDFVIFKRCFKYKCLAINFFIGDVLILNLCFVWFLRLDYKLPGQPLSTHPVVPGIIPYI